MASAAISNAFLCLPLLPNQFVEEEQNGSNGSCAAVALSALESVKNEKNEKIYFIQYRKNDLICIVSSKKKKFQIYLLR